MNSKRRAWTTWIGCTIAGALMGMAYGGLTLFYDVILEHTGCSPTEFGLIFTLISVGMIIGGLFIGKLIEKNSKLFSTLGAVGAILMYGSICIATNIFIIFVCAFLFGFLFNFIGSTLTSIMLSQWFNSGRARVVSYANTVASALPIVLTPVFAGLVTGMGGLNAALLIGIVTTVICIVCSVFLISRFPASYNMKPVDIGKGDSEKKAKEESVDEYEFSMPAGKMAATPAFILCFIGIFLISAANGVYYTNTTMLYQSFGLEYTEAALATSISSIAALAMVPLMGILMDKIGMRFATMLFAALSAIGCLLTPVLAGWTGAIVIAIMINGCKIWMMIGPAVLPRIFGVKKSPQLVAWAITGASVGTMVFGPIATTIYGATGSYAVPMVIGGVLLVLAMVVLYIAMGKKSAEAVRRRDQAYAAKHAA